MVYWLLPRLVNDSLQVHEVCGRITRDLTAKRELRANLLRQQHMLMEILCRDFQSDKGREYDNNGKAVAEID
jgi:hypothetical protein